MSDQFHLFARAVCAQFATMSKEPLFIVGNDRDEVWDRYLSSFPDGTNPIFRQRTEHDCSCCRHFIRSAGNIVAIQNGALTSVWDLNGLPDHYQAVADAMAAYVKALPITDMFFTRFSSFGQEQSHEHLKGGGVRTWNHFHVSVSNAFICSNPDERMGDRRTTQQVLLRGLRELSPAAVDNVLDLIDSNAIYRGEEHKHAVKEFAALQDKVLAAPPEKQELLAWANVMNPAARFRNTVIGTLVQDISDGVDIERAVKSFETKVAPSNYKRPTALITKRMVEDAMKTIRELDLEPALQRRHARLEDVSVNSVLFVDNSVQGRMKGGIESMLMEAVKPAPFDTKKAEEISVDNFMSLVLPKTQSLQLYLDSSLMGNFVSLTAPVHDGSRSLFKWDNDFAWSYDGNVTDSIKERVKRAGGKVEGVTARVSLAWFNTDDLDLHVTEPSGLHIYFGNKMNKLDVDMNVHHLVRDPVENVRWVGRMTDGVYKVWVNQFNRREVKDFGFDIEIESDIGLSHWSFNKAVPSHANQEVGTFLVKGGRMVEFYPSQGMIGGNTSQEKWGLKTLNTIKVNSVVLSPNHWDDNAVGNKHWFFILDGCKNDQPVRGIYNEFLHSRLDKHRKVFEVLGDKTKCPVADEQLSGVGFSSTRKDKVSVVAMGPNLNKTYTIVF